MCQPGLLGYVKTNPAYCLNLKGYLPQRHRGHRESLRRRPVVYSEFFSMLFMFFNFMKTEKSRGTCLLISGGFAPLRPQPPLRYFNFRVRYCVPPCANRIAGLRANHRVTKCAQFFDGHFDTITRFEKHAGVSCHSDTSWRACENEIAWNQCHQGC